MSSLIGWGRSVISLRQRGPKLQCNKLMVFFGVFYGFEFKFGKDSILLCECNRFYNAFIVIKTLCPKRSYPKVVEVGMHVGQPRRSTGFSSSRAVGAAQHLLGIIGHDFLSQNFL